MFEKVLMINGSPRAGRSNTILLTNSFLEGFQEVNQQAKVETIVLKEQDIKPCQGCFSCWKDPNGACVLKDDMAPLLEKYKATDLVIWSFPLYHFGMPSIVKAFHERTLPLLLPFIETNSDGTCRHPARDTDLPAKKHVVISTCGFCTTRNNYEALTKHLDFLYRDDYENIFCVEGELLKVPQLAQIARPYTEMVKRAGNEYAATGRISRDTRAALETPMLEPKAFLEMANANWGMEERRSSDPHTGLKAFNFMRQMRASFNPEASRGVNSVLQINYTDLNEAYQFVIKEQSCELLIEAAHIPTTTIDTDYDTWKKISEGSLDGAQAMMQKRYRVSGDFDFMMLMSDLFGGRRVKSQEEQAKPAEASKKSKMLLFLLPWIVLWVILPFNSHHAPLAALAVAALVVAAGHARWEFTTYELVNPLILTGILILVMFTSADLQIIMAASYFIFALLWLASFFVRIPLTAWYSRYSMGAGALANRLFIKTNYILTILWGLLFLATAIWTYYLWYTPLFKYSGILNQIAPALMGLFTAWFAKWYPARVARG